MPKSQSGAQNKHSLLFSSCSFSSQKFKRSTLVNSHKVKRYGARVHICMCMCCILTSYGDTFCAICWLCNICMCMCVCESNSTQPTRCLSISNNLHCIVFNEFEEENCLPHTHKHTFRLALLGKNNRSHVFVFVYLLVWMCLYQCHRCVASFWHNWIIIIIGASQISTFSQYIHTDNTQFNHDTRRSSVAHTEGEKER